MAGLKLQAVIEQLSEILSELTGVRRYIVGLSGGLDSTVLLHALLDTVSRAQILAVHVNHGLQAEAGLWEQHCREICESYGVSLEVNHVNAHPGPGESPEAAARDARYSAFRAIMSENDCLLTAHHQDDQAETLLLQLLRGSGPAGLASMPNCRDFGPGRHLRPLLNVSRKSLQEYAAGAGLSWVEDPSNTGLNIDRNYIRHRLVPVLEERWPGFSKTLSRSARHQADADALLMELAEQDARLLQGQYQNTLSIQGLMSLSLPRRRNVVRYWLRRQNLPLPSEAVLEQVMRMPAAAADRNPECRWHNVQVCRYRDDLYFLQSPSESTRSSFKKWLLDGPLYISELGITLVPADLLSSGLQLGPDIDCLNIRFRRGGERIQLPGRQHTHSLKKILQEKAVPPWLRDRLPLLFHNDRLIAVAGLDPMIIAEGYCADRSLPSADG